MQYFQIRNIQHNQRETANLFLRFFFYANIVPNPNRFSVIDMRRQRKTYEIRSFHIYKWVWSALPLCLLNFDDKRTKIILRTIHFKAISYFIYSSVNCANIHNAIIVDSRESNYTVVALLLLCFACPLFHSNICIYIR